MGHKKIGVASIGILNPSTGKVEPLEIIHKNVEFVNEQGKTTNIDFTQPITFECSCWNNCEGLIKYLQRFFKSKVRSRYAMKKYALRNSDILKLLKKQTRR